MSDYYDDDVPAIVMDCGSSRCCAGFAGEDGCRSVFSSVVGRPRFQHEEINIDHMVGDEAQINREFLSLSYPIQRGIVTNWDDAEKLWDFCFKDLKVDPTDQPLLMSEQIFNPSGHKERMLETMFETFRVPHYFPKDTATLILYASGRGVGMVLDVGEGVTSVVPIYYFTAPTPHAIQRQEFAGKDVTLYLQKLLQQRGLSYTTTSELEYVREIKESVCYASLDYEKEMSESLEDELLILPDGNKLSIGKEKFQSTECLFQPSLTGQHGLKGLHELLESCIKNCDMYNRRDLYYNVILSGRGTFTQNLPERLGKLWEDIVPKTMKARTRFVVLPERSYSVWIGGSICASLSTFQKAWISKQDYEEFGPSIVHRRRL